MFSKKMMITKSYSFLDGENITFLYDVLSISADVSSARYSEQVLKRFIQFCDNIDKKWHENNEQFFDSRDAPQNNVV